MKKLSGIALAVSVFISTTYAATPGTIKWSFNVQDRVVGAPAVAADGTIYAPNASQFLWAINPNGTKKWATYVQLPINGSPAVAADGGIYLSTDTATQSLLYKILPTGAIAWASGTPNPPAPQYCKLVSVYFSLISAPVIADPSTVTILSWTETNLVAARPQYGPPCSSGGIGTVEALYYVDPNTGTQYLGPALRPFNNTTSSQYLNTVPLSWLRKPYADATTGITATTENTVDTYGNLSAPGLIIGYHATGAGYAPLIPAADAGKLTSPVGGGKGILYVGDTQGNLFKYDGAGNLLMTLHLHGDLTGAAPVAASNGITYVGSSDGYIYAVDPNGTWDWSTFVDSGGINQPVAIDPTTGNIYVTAATGHVYAITAPTVGPDGTVYVANFNNSIVAING